MNRYFKKDSKIVYPPKGEGGQPYVVSKRKTSITPEPDEFVSHASGESKKQKKKAFEFIEHLRPQQATTSGRLLIKDKPTSQTPQEPERPAINEPTSRIPQEPKRPKNPESLTRSRKHTRSSDGVPPSISNSNNDPYEHHHNTRETDIAYYRIREMEIAAGKQRERGGTLLDHIPELSSIKRELGTTSGSKRWDRAEFGSGGPSSSRSGVNRWDWPGGIPPPVPEVPGLREDHYRRPD